MNINKYTEKAQEAILAAQQLADREGESYLNIVVRQSGRYINNVVFQHPLAGGSPGQGRRT